MDTINSIRAICPDCRQPVKWPLLDTDALQYLVCFNCGKRFPCVVKPLYGQNQESGDEPW